MTHNIKLKRRTVEGILSSVVGGGVVASLIQKSFALAAVTIVVFVALLITEKADIEEEEQ